MMSQIIVILFKQRRESSCKMLLWCAGWVKDMPSRERTWLGFQEYIPSHPGQHSSLTRWAADLAFFRISTSGDGTSSADIGTNNADISRSAADIGKNASNKSTKNLRRSPRPHSPGAAGRVNTRLCLVVSRSTSGWRSKIIRLQHSQFPFQHSNNTNFHTILILKFFLQGRMPGHVKKGGKQEQDPDPSPWQVSTNPFTTMKVDKLWEMSFESFSLLQTIFMASLDHPFMFWV